MKVELQYELYEVALPDPENPFRYIVLRRKLSDGTFDTPKIILPSHIVDRLCYGQHFKLTFNIEES